MHDHSFSTSSLACFRIRIMHVWGFCIGSGVGIWLSTHLVIPFSHLASNIFSFMIHTKLGLLHLLQLSLSHYIYGQLLDPMGIHLFHCVHGGVRMVSHDAMWDAFTSIMKDICFHVACEQTHILLLPTFQSSCQ